MSKFEGVFWYNFAFCVKDKFARLNAQNILKIYEEKIGKTVDRVYYAMEATIYYYKIILMNISYC